MPRSDSSRYSTSSTPLHHNVAICRLAPPVSRSFHSNHNDKPAMACLPALSEPPSFTALRHSVLTAVYRACLCSGCETIRLGESRPATVPNDFNVKRASPALPSDDLRALGHLQLHQAPVHCLQPVPDPAPQRRPVPPRNTHGEWERFQSNGTPEADLCRQLRHERRPGSLRAERDACTTTAPGGAASL